MLSTKKLLKMVDVKLGASTLSQREKRWMNFEMDTALMLIMIIYLCSEDIMLSIKGFERISVTEQEVINAGQVCQSQSQVY